MSSLRILTSLVWQCVWMFLFSCLNKTIVRTTSCAAACTWTLILTKRRRIWIHTHSHTLSHSLEHVGWTWVAAMMSSNWDICFCSFSFARQGRQLRTLHHSGWSEARIGRRRNVFSVRGQVSERGEKHTEEGRGGEKRRRRGRKEGEGGCQARCQHAGLIWKTISAAAVTGKGGWIRFCIRDTTLHSQRTPICTRVMFTHISLL